jgi:murein tripeptide amidase MpaA
MKTPTPKGASIVGKFARYNEIQSYLDDVTKQNSDIASTYIAGQTYEKRNLRVLVLKTSTSKRNVWLDCGIHAREWITPATCVWMINNLINEHRANSKSSLLNYFEFHILPLLNPDGYEYSHSTYRMWRKNRNPNSGSSCIGTDLNRNYGFKGMVSLTFHCIFF